MRSYWVSGTNVDKKRCYLFRFPIVPTIGTFPVTRNEISEWLHFERDLVRHYNKQTGSNDWTRIKVVFLCRDPFYNVRI